MNISTQYNWWQRWVNSKQCGNTIGATWWADFNSWKWCHLVTKSVGFRHNSIGPLCLWQCFFLWAKDFLWFIGLGVRSVKQKDHILCNFQMFLPKFILGVKSSLRLWPQSLSHAFAGVFVSAGKRFPSPAWRPSWPWRVPSSAIQLAIRHLPSRRGRHSRRAKGGPSVEREWVRFSSAPPAAHRARLSCCDFSADSAGISRNPDSKILRTTFCFVGPVLAEEWTQLLQLWISDSELWFGCDFLEVWRVQVGWSSIVYIFY